MNPDFLSLNVLVHVRWLSSQDWVKMRQQGDWGRHPTVSAGSLPPLCHSHTALPPPWSRSHRRKEPPQSCSRVCPAGSWGCGPSGTFHSCCHCSCWTCEECSSWGRTAHKLCLIQFLLHVSFHLIINPRHLIHNMLLLDATFSGGFFLPNIWLVRDEKFSFCDNV